MADIRINALATTAASTASDDFVAVDGSANGTRKLNAYSPTFGGNLTVSGTASVTGQINGSAGYQFRAASGTTYELLRYVGGTNNPGIFTTVNESTKKVTIFASGSLVSGQTLGLGAEGSEALTLGAANATLSGNLTVSGTGQSSVSGYLSINSALAGSTYGRVISGTTTAGVPAFFATNAVNASLAIDFPSASVARIRTNAGSEIMAFSIGTTERARFETTGNFLVGTTTDSGQKLQVNGTALFGTDNASLGAYFDYNGGISGNATLWLRQTTKSSSTYTLTGGGTYTALNAPSGGSIYLRINNSDALTLDSSQNATFAGNITVDKATPAILVKRGANTQNGQLQFATGASGDFAIGNRGTSDSDLHIYNYGLSADSVTISKNTSAVTFAGSIAINNTVQTAAAVASTHKVTVVIGGVTYYLLATNI